MSSNFPILSGIVSLPFPALINATPDIGMAEDIFFANWLTEANNRLDSIRRSHPSVVFGGDSILQPESSVDLTWLQAQCTWKISDLIAFYSVCGGVNCPSIGNGYFIDSVVRLHERSRLSDPFDPILLVGPIATSIFVLGSTGMGHLIAISMSDETVFLLEEGLIENQAFHAEQHNERTIAPSWRCFLMRMLTDWEAYDREVPGYSFIA